MNHEGQEWFDQLTSATQEFRKEIPMPTREELNEPEEWQCRITGSSLVNWLDNVGDNILQERSMFCKLKEIEPDPFLVFTSNRPGLVAINQIVGVGNERIVFRDQIDTEFQQQAEEQFPIPQGSSYWQHSEGTIWAQLAGRGGDHLWKWDGNEPELLEEAFTQWVT